MELPYLISFFAASSFAAPLDYLRNQLDHMTESLQPNEKTLSLQLDLALFILDLSRSLNKFYSMQIFLLCCRVLINFILSGYFIIDSFRTNSLFTPSEVIWINYLVSVALVVSFAGDLSVLIRICSSCTNFQNAVESFNDKLFSLMREHNDLCKNDKLCLFLTIKQRVQFTACGFYSLGYPLVTSIIATATTHLVILVQFTSPD
nr:gustatory and pheromone receptor 32a-like [Halyomorpha halys]